MSDRSAEPKIREQAPVTHFVDEPELVISLDESDCLEGNCSAADVQKLSDAIVSQPAKDVVSTNRNWRTRRVSNPLQLQQVNLPNEIDPHEGNSSAHTREVQKTNDAIVLEPVRVIRYVDESQLDDSADDLDQLTAPEGKPSLGDIAEICNELRRLRINPQPCLGVVRKYWGNVTGAFARVKEAIALWLVRKSDWLVYQFL